MKLPEEISPNALETECNLIDEWSLSEGSEWELCTDDETLQEAALNMGKSGKPEGVIGVVRGPFFFPDGISENKRFYPRDLWESVLRQERIQEKLKNRTMFGQMGHNDRPVNDTDLAEGKVSHFISKLHVNGQQGMGEALILDTPAGRNLLAPLKAGCKIKISSRATGSFCEGRTGPNGIPVVDKEKYILETFDFVINAGFKNTDPQLAEGKIKTSQISMTENSNNQLISQLMENRDTAQNQLSEALGNLESLRQENTDLREQLEMYRDENRASERVQILGENVASKFGEPSVEHLIEMLDSSDITAIQTVANLGLTEHDLRAWMELGDPDKINEAVDAGIETIEEYREFGDPEQIQETIEIVDEALESYLQLGSVQEIREKLEYLADMEHEMEERHIAEAARIKAAQYGLDIAAVERLVEKFSDEEELDEMLESLAFASNSNSSENLYEDVETPFGSAGSTAASARLFQSLTRN